jgi:hypothetical protein
LVNAFEAKGPEGVQGQLRRFAREAAATLALNRKPRRGLFARARNFLFSLIGE